MGGGDCGLEKTCEMSQVGQRSAMVPLDKYLTAFHDRHNLNHKWKNFEVGVRDVILVKAAKRRVNLYPRGKGSTGEAHSTPLSNGVEL